MKNKLLIFISILISTSLYCQADSLFFNTYYESNEYLLLASHRAELNLFLEKINTNKIEKITLFGHTDSDASDDYNNTLSKNRVDGVYEFLIKKGLQKEQLEKKYFGEFVPIATNENELGKGKNRRVEMLVFFKKKKRKITYITKTNPPKKEKKPIPIEEKIVEEKTVNKCHRDTIIEFEKGVHAAINICEYEKIKDCIVINIQNDVDVLVSSGVTTYDNLGNPLISCGMASVSVKPGCKPCFDTPIKIRFPVIGDNCEKKRVINPSLYNLSGGVWKINPKERIKQRTINRVRYNEITFICQGGKNCDKKDLCSIETKIKFRDKRKFISANIVNTCNFGNLPLKINKRGKAKGKISKITEDDFLFAKYQNQKGDTIEVKEPLFNSSSIKILKGKNYCKKNKSINLIHFPLMKNTNSSFVQNESDSNFSNAVANIFTGSSFTSLEIIFSEFKLIDDFSYQLGGGIYRNYSDGNILTPALENKIVQLKNGIQQVGLNGHAAINSPYFWDGFSTTFFTQLGFGTNLAKIQSNENFEILEQKKLNGWGITSNLGLTLDSPPLWKRFKISLGGTYNITFTKLAEFKTFQFILAEPEQSHQVKFTSNSNSILATLNLKFYLNKL